MSVSILTRARFREANGSLDWLQQAACKGETGQFFSRNEVDLERARGLCAGCPVRDACLAYALSDQNLHGIWGGLTARQRRDLRWGKVA